MHFKDLLRYRQAWLGIALLWIIVYHLPFALPLVNFPKIIGYGGVDICFFASGIGCFYSLTADSDIGNFIQRRLKRLMPTYVVFMIGWLAVKLILGDFSIPMAIGNLLALQHFSGHENAFNWYIGAALLFYFLAPYFKMIVDRSSPACKYLFLLFLFVCSVPFWQANTHIITVSRLPVFYIGMLIADLCRQSKRISVGHVLGAILSCVLGLLFLAVSFKWASQYLWSHGLYWYPFALITPPLCMAISYFLFLCERIKIAKPIHWFLSLCGSYSFELYLVHILLFFLIPLVIEKFSLSNVRLAVWTAGIIALIPGCFILRRLTSLCIGFFDKKQHIWR